MVLNGPMRPEDQDEMAMTMVRGVLIFTGVLAMAMWPFVLALMALRDKVNNCNWNTSDIEGSGSWSFVPPQLTCSWPADKLDEINAWAAANGVDPVALEPGATQLSEQIPVLAVAWVTFAMFVIGLLIVRLGMVLRTPSRLAK